MKFLTVILLTVSTSVLAQPYANFWPQDMLSAIKNNQSKAVGTIYGDTLFHYTRIDSIQYLTDPNYYYEVTSFSNGEYQVDTYNRLLSKNKEKISHSTFFRADSTKYKQITSPAKPTGIIQFYKNGVVSLNRQISDGIETTISQDSLEAYYESKTYVDGSLQAFSFKKDTIINGMNMSYELHVRLPNDTIYIQLKDGAGRTWYQKNEDEIIKRTIIDSDTVITTQVKGDLISRETFGLDSIAYFIRHSQNAYSETVQNRLDLTGYSKYFINNELKNGKETVVNANGVKSESYDIVNGEKVITSTTIDLPGNKTIFKNYKEGKVHNKAISEYTEDGQLIKTTRWIDGKKTVVMAEDFSLPTTKTDGIPYFINPRQVNPIVDSLLLVVDGQVIEDIKQNKIFIKIANNWLNYNQFESHLRALYLHETRTRKPNIKLELIEQNGMCKSKFYGPYKWGELFESTLDLTAVSYDALRINGIDKSRDEIKLTLYISLTDKLIPIKKNTIEARLSNKQQ